MNSNFLTLAQQRYSVRQFSGKPVEQTAIEAILRAGQLAPTACNNQPQKVFVIQSEDALTKLRRCTSSHFNAPLGILVCYDRTQSWKRSFDGQDSGWVDASIVATHMMLEAWEQGVGSTWVMHFIPDAVQTEFELTESIIPVALLVMGYPAENAAPHRLHTESKSIEELASYL